MKKLLSTIMIATVLGSATYTPKSEAGVAIVGATATHCAFKCAETSRGPLGPSSTAIAFGTPALIGTMPIIGGAIMIAFGGVAFAPGIALLILDENGGLSQTELESALADKYSFIADREVIATLASEIKSKADSVEVDAQGMKMVSLSEDEVKSILSATELTDEEISIITNDLK